MDLNASGWRRDMGQHKLGSIDLIDADIKDFNDEIAWSPSIPTVIIGDDKVTIGWRAELTLNGSYLVTVDLPKYDIARLFIFLFGVTLDPQDIKKFGIDVDAKSLLARTLMKMPFGEVLATLNDMTKPNASILASDVSTRAFCCLQNQGIRTYEELAAKSQTEMLRIPNLGRKVLNELKELLHARGLSFAA